MPLFPLSAALTIGALSLGLAVHAAGAQPQVSTSDEPAVTVTAQGAGPDTGCAAGSGAPVAPCDINLFGGGALAPGSSHTTVMIVRNTGRPTLRTLTLTAAPCRITGSETTAPAGALCSMLRLTVTTVAADGRSTTPVRSRRIARLGDAPIRLPAPRAPGERETVLFTITLDRSASPAVMGSAVSQPISWQVAG